MGFGYDFEFKVLQGIGFTTGGKTRPLTLL